MGVTVVTLGEEASFFFQCPLLNKLTLFTDQVFQHFKFNLHGHLANS